MSAAREAMLMRLLLGELEPHSDEARRFFVEDPEAEAELEHLRGLEQSVLAGGEEQRQVLDEASRTPGAPGEDAVAALVQQHFESTDQARGPKPMPASRRPIKRWLPLLVAAGILLMLLPRFFGDEASGPIDPGGAGPVMGLGLRDLSPTGEIVAYSEFRWDSDALEHHHFRVFVYNAVEPDGGPEIDRSRELDDPRWNPDAQQHESWPDAIRWEVVVFDGQTPLGAASATASRR